MKALCVIDTLGPGGAQRQLVGLSTFLQKYGMDVQVLSYYDDSFYVEELIRAEVSYKIITSAKNPLTRYVSVSRYIKDQSPDVVIAFLEMPSIMCCIARLFNHTFRLFVSERNTNQNINWKDRLRFNMYRIADFIIPNSYSQKKFIEQYFLKLMPKVVTIPNFVDLDMFVPNEHQRGEVPEILVVASVWPPKNTIGFISALAQLKNRAVSLHVSWYGLIGNPISEYQQQCLDEIKRFGLEDYIQLFPKTKQIKEKYQAADYFCLPSFFEGTPNVLCEAMATGLPVVCSSVCDNAEYVHEGENGFLFNPCDAGSIASAIEKLIKLSDEDYKSFCIESRHIAEKKLSKSRFVQQYIELIEKL